MGEGRGTGTQTSGLMFPLCSGSMTRGRRREGPGWGGLHARALGAVAVGAPIGRLPAALARDPAPHLHGDASLRAPPDVAAQLLGGPFCDRSPTSSTEREQGQITNEASLRTLLKVTLFGGGVVGRAVTGDRGTAEMTSRAGLQLTPGLAQGSDTDKADQKDGWRQNWDDGAGGVWSYQVEPPTPAALGSSPSSLPGSPDSYLPTQFQPLLQRVVFLPLSSGKFAFCWICSPSGTYLAQTSQPHL